MMIFSISYCTCGVRVINYDYYYNHVFFGYSKREIEKKVRETLGLKYKRGVLNEKNVCLKYKERKLKND